MRQRSAYAWGGLGLFWLRLNHMPYVVRNSHLHTLVNKPSLLQIIIAAAFNDHVQFAGNGQAIAACSRSNVLYHAIKYRPWPGWRLIW